MSGRVKAHDPYTFTRAAHDELRDLQTEYGVRWRLRVYETDQRGVFAFTWSVTDVLGPLDGPALCAYTNTWPSADTQTWEAFAYSCAHRLARMVEARFREYERQVAQGE